MIIVNMHGIADRGREHGERSASWRRADRQCGGSAEPGAGGREHGARGAIRQLAESRQTVRWERGAGRAELVVKGIAQKCKVVERVEKCNIVRIFAVH